MQEITDLERRITAALERIGRGIAGVGQTAGGTPSAAFDGALPLDAQDLQAALEEERMANAQLQDRLRTLRDKDAADRQRQTEELTALQAELQAERRDTAQLREQVDGLEQDLATLRAERRAEQDQITDIVAALNPLIEEAKHA